MSKATICDRCGKVLNCSPSAKVEVEFHYQGVQYYELCEECKNYLVRWITMLRYKK